MKSLKIVLIISVCIAIVFTILIIASNYLGDLIGDQRERNYLRFVQNMNGLTETFHQQVEECAIREVEKQDKDCVNKLEEEYRNQFGSLIKLFGYESHVQELYQYWQADLKFWYEAKKIKIQNNENESENELSKILEVRNKAVKARLEPSFLLVDPNQK